MKALTIALKLKQARDQGFLETIDILEILEAVNETLIGLESRLKSIEEKLSGEHEF